VKLASLVKSWLFLETDLVFRFFFANLKEDYYEVAVPERMGKEA